MALPPAYFDSFAIASAVLFVFLVAIGTFVLTTTNNKLRAAAHEWRRRFFTEVLALRRKKDTLSDYTPEYYHAFQEGRWGDLKEILDALSYVEETVDLYLAQGRLKEAILLCRYLLNDLEDEELQASRRKFTHLNRIENWREETREILVRLSETIGAAASETKKIGVDRSRRRKPTLLTMTEILSEGPK